MSLTWEYVWGRVEGVNAHYSLNEQELKFLIEWALQLPQEPCVLELGVCHGRTLAALGLVAFELGACAHGVDHFGLEGSAEAVRDTLRRVGSTALVIPMDTKEVPWDDPIDLLLVD